MRKFMTAAALVAVAACGGGEADQEADNTMAPAPMEAATDEGAMPATNDSMPPAPEVTEEQ